MPSKLFQTSVVVMAGVRFHTTILSSGCPFCRNFSLFPRTVLLGGPQFDCANLPIVCVRWFARLHDQAGSAIQLADRRFHTLAQFFPNMALVIDHRKNGEEGHV
jgi:hypothetical protein